MVAAFLVFLSAQIQTCTLSNYRSACLLPTLSVYYYPQTFFLIQTHLQSSKACHNLLSVENLNSIETELFLKQASWQATTSSKIPAHRSCCQTLTLIASRSPGPQHTQQYLHYLSHLLLPFEPELLQLQMISLLGVDGLRLQKCSKQQLYESPLIVMALFNHQYRWYPSRVRHQNYDAGDPNWIYSRLPLTQAWWLFWLQEKDSWAKNRIYLRSPTRLFKSIFSPQGKKQWPNTPTCWSRGRGTGVLAPAEIWLAPEFSPFASEHITGWALKGEIKWYE